MDCNGPKVCLLSIDNTQMTHSEIQIAISEKFPLQDFLSFTGSRQMYCDRECSFLQGPVLLLTRLAGSYILLLLLLLLLSLLWPNDFQGEQCELKSNWNGGAAKQYNEADFKVQYKRIIYNIYIFMMLPTDRVPGWREQASLAKIAIRIQDWDDSLGADQQVLSFSKLLGKSFTVGQKHFNPFII